jgi:hypothetical protein
MIRSFSKIRPHLASALQDIAGIGGAVLVSYGAGQIYAPACPIMAGAFLLTGAWLAARARR